MYIWRCKVKNTTVFDRTLLFYGRNETSIKSTGKLRTCTQAYVFLSANNWIIHCLSTCITLLSYMCRRGMDDYHTQKCSYPDCCKDIRISEPKIFNVTRIENSCSTLSNEKQNYRITFTKGTSWMWTPWKCCNGVIYVYFGTYQCFGEEGLRSADLRASYLPINIRLHVIWIGNKTK